MITVQASGARVEHFGQHGEKCFGCKLKTIKFGSVSPPTHNPKGDRWETDPVQERINELREQGKRVSTMELAAPDKQE